MRTLPFLHASLLLAASAFAAEPPDVRRIFAEHCLECHGPDKSKGGLTLTSRENVLKPLESGSPAVVPGDVKGSALIARVLSHDPEEQMPPKKKKPLAPVEIEALKKWVAEGAEWKVHWAYSPIARAALPEARKSEVGNPIDRFVLSKLAEKKIAPSPEADRYTLVRRVHYDLLGLPPTPEEADAFVNDTAPDAYERLVDRALASPHFGERWGRHWLDQARYADSDGYEKDKPRPDAWRYRDWVIDAVNRDLPFDRFTIEQLAGDLLPDATPEQKLATAFHRQTLTNTEGGADQEQFRVEATFDRTETTGAVWLGLTVGCARCHSHKYDQLTQREYYQLFAFFNNADETKTSIGTSVEAVAEYERKNAAHVARLKPLAKRLTTVRERLAATLLDWEKEIAQRLAAAEGKTAELRPLELTRVTGAGSAEFQRLDDGSWLASGEQAATDTYTLVADAPAGLIGGLRLELLPDPSLPKQGPGRSETGNCVLSEIAVVVKGEPIALHSPEADFSQKDWPVAAALDGKLETGWGIAPQLGKAHHATFQFVHPLDGAQVRQIVVSLVQQFPKKSHAIGRFRLVALVGETPESIAPKEVRGLVGTGSEKWTAENKEVLVNWLQQTNPEASRAAAELAAARAAAPPPPVLDVRILTQRGQPRDTKILHRGEFLSPTDPVLPGTPVVLPPIAARNGKEPDRLDLARWLVSPQNPLTSRVIVNQLWAHLFGEGLVRSLGDFGVRGDKPTHPELLDWLAGEFIARGWSRKEMIRLIATSATYRQRSEVRPELAEIDPLNQLLARQNRVRVEGEIVRDLHLAASGLLSEKIGGPSVFPPMPPEIAALSYANNFKWTDATGDDRHRRGMYTFFKRTAPHPDLTTFDCPDANLASIKRSISDTPLQALTTLNAQCFAEAAQTMARRLLAEPLADDEARLDRVFRLCVARPPHPREVAALRQLLATARDYYAQSSDKDAEPAAWTATVRIVMNTDEFITRE